MYLPFVLLEPAVNNVVLSKILTAFPFPSSAKFDKLNLVILPSRSLKYINPPVNVIPVAVSGVINTGDPGVELTISLDAKSSISITL